MWPVNWKDPESNRFLIIDDAAISLIREYLQTRPMDPEAGGMLLGMRRGKHLQITMATPPQLTDRRSRINVVRNSLGHEELLRQEYSQSDGYIGYLGEWHTHPQRHPSPSDRDFNTWREISKSINYPLIMIIAGTASITCYLCTANKTTEMTFYY